MLTKSILDTKIRVAENHMVSHAWNVPEKSVLKMKGVGRMARGGIRNENRY
jgi:hypothetical protein